MFKKIFIIVIVILLLIGGIVSYFLLFGKKETPAGTDTGFSLQDLFPFGDAGKGTAGSNNNGEEITDNPLPDQGPEPTKPPRLRMVNKGPVAGAFAFNVIREKPVDPTRVDSIGNPLPIETESATKVRYVETSTGHTDETYLDVIDVKKLTNTTIPKITEAYFGGKGGQNAILRYADANNIIQTFAGVISILGDKNGIPDTTLRGSYMSENIIGFAVSPDREKVFSISLADGGVVGNVSLADGTKKNQIFSSAYTEWLTEWPSVKFATITTKPSAKVPGYSYSIDVSSKVMKKVIGGVFGLTTLTSPDGKNILFSRSSNGTVAVSVFNTASKGLSSLPGATTLPEKCVWQSVAILYCAVPSFIPTGDYPDAWYQGNISFTDQIYKIDIVDFTSTVIGNPAAVDASIDAINLSVDASNTFLIFTNKKDGALWSLDLRPE